MTAIDRRQALRIGGLSTGVAAFAVACGGGGDEASEPGRVGFLPPVTDPPDLTVDDAVLLRTASSLETTAIDVYTGSPSITLTMGESVGTMRVKRKPVAA